MAIVGPSGAGKSTVLRIVAGLRRPDPAGSWSASEVWLDSGRGVDLRPEERSCGFMFQDYALFPHLSAWRNVAFGISGPGASAAIAPWSCSSDSGSASLRTHGPASLSGGERQRVALARALARDPERAAARRAPVGARRPHPSARRPRAGGGAHRTPGVPAIVVTHDFAEAALLADEICVMDRGRIVQRGTAAELLGPPRLARSSPSSRARSCSTGWRSARAGGLSRVELDGGGAAPQHRPDRGPRRRLRLSLGDQPWSRRAPSRAARPSTGSPSRSSRWPRSGIASGSGLVRPAAAGGRGHRRVYPLAGLAPGRPSSRRPGRRPRRGWCRASRRSGSSSVAAGGTRPR